MYSHSHSHVSHHEYILNCDCRQQSEQLRLGYAFIDDNLHTDGDDMYGEQIDHVVESGVRDME